jgi:hypothetical protein
MCLPALAGYHGDMLQVWSGIAFGAVIGVGFGVAIDFAHSTQLFDGRFIGFPIDEFEAALKGGRRMIPISGVAGAILGAWLGWNRRKRF